MGLMKGVLEPLGCLSYLGLRDRELALFKRLEDTMGRTGTTQNYTVVNFQIGYFDSTFQIWISLLGSSTVRSAPDRLRFEISLGI